jgi:hypothetical protein
MRHDGPPTVRTPRRAGAVALGIAAAIDKLAPEALAKD